MAPETSRIEPRGLLNPKTGERSFKLVLHAPSAELALLVEHYWVIRWDLRGQPPYLSENLTHPSVHIVIQEGQSGVFGVTTGKFAYLVEGQGWVFGIKVRPAAWYPLTGVPASTLTDRSVALSDIFGADGPALEAEILALDDDEAMVAAAERFLRARQPAPDESWALVSRIVEAIAADGSIVKVEDLVERFCVSKRSLQRMFSQYVGVSPKWVIRRYRLHEAAEALARGAVEDWAALALNLGYFDQAHFIKDFKAVVGQTPADYARHQ